MASRRSSWYSPQMAQQSRLASLRRSSGRALPGFIPAARTAPCTVACISRLACGNGSSRERWARIWSQLMVLFLLYTTCVVPVQISFTVPTLGSAWMVVDMVADAMYWIDLLVNVWLSCRTGGRSNCLQYLRTWFVVDLCSVLPIYRVLEAASGGRISPAYLRLAYTVRLMRLLKWVRVRSALTAWGQSSGRSLLDPNVRLGFSRTLPPVLVPRPRHAPAAPAPGFGLPPRAPLTPDTRGHAHRGEDAARAHAPTVAARAPSTLVGLAVDPPALRSAGRRPYHCMWRPPRRGARARDRAVSEHVDPSADRRGQADGPDGRSVRAKTHTAAL